MPKPRKDDPFGGIHQNSHSKVLQKNWDSLNYFTPFGVMIKNMVQL